MQSLANDGFGRPPVTAAAEVNRPALDEMDTALQAYSDTGEVPGLVYAIAHQGKVVRMRPLGYQDLARQMPMEADTLFRWYSLTKPVTAVAIMMLVDQGLLSLNAPVAHWLPAFDEMTVSTDRGYVPLERPVTVLDLLTHRAGLSYAADFQAWGFSESKARLTDEDLGSYVAKLTGYPLITQPGTEWRFSDGYSVLARIVELITEQRYGDFLRQRIFQPLGMVDTGYWVPEAKKDQLAQLYVQSHEDGGLRETRDFGGDYTVAPGFEAGGSGLVGSAADYLRFAQMLLNRGELDGVRLLSANAVDAIFTDYLAGDSRNHIPEGKHHFFRGMGMGLGGYVVFDTKARGIAGANGQYRCYGLANTFFWIDPQHQLTGLCFTQVIDRFSSLQSLRNDFHRLTYQAIEREGLK